MAGRRNRKKKKKKKTPAFEKVSKSSLEPQKNFFETSKERCLQADTCYLHVVPAHPINAASGNSVYNILSQSRTASRLEIV